MKTLVGLFILFSLSACSHSPKKTEYNYVTHEKLEAEFVKEKEKVCNHFSKSNEMFVSKTNYRTTYWRKVGNEFHKVEKKSRFEVTEENVPAWHCGETTWAINTNLTQEAALGRDVPVEK